MEVYWGPLQFQIWSTGTISLEVLTQQDRNRQQAQSKSHFIWCREQWESSFQPNRQSAIAPECLSSKKTRRHWITSKVISSHNNSAWPDWLRLDSKTTVNCNAIEITSWLIWPSCMPFITHLGSFIFLWQFSVFLYSCEYHAISGGAPCRTLEILSTWSVHEKPCPPLCKSPCFQEKKSLRACINPKAIFSISWSPVFNLRWL